jgi:hypothetical protein
MFAIFAIFAKFTPHGSCRAIRGYAPQVSSITRSQFP